MPLLRLEYPVVTTESDLLARAANLRGAWVVGVDLDLVDLDWGHLDVTKALFAGCRMSAPIEASLRSAGASVLHDLEGIDFDPYRVSLYSNSELMAGYVSGEPTSALDAQIGVVSAREGSLDRLARGIHDACIDAALLRFLSDLGAPVVGIMGSHTTARGSAEYVEVASLGRDLTRAGFVVATGGGPGLMEAANLGAWLAVAPDDALGEACELLAQVPGYSPDLCGYIDRALDVRARWPHASTNLGVPTWIYVDEPVNQFATHIAKYFQNSIRENGLLAIAHAGIVYTPGGSGTLQELFTDAAQNEYTLYGIRSPMVLMGPEYQVGALQEAAAALRAAATRAGWEALVRVVDDARGAFDAVEELRPADVIVPRPPLRKR